jgi:hypothetical protein
MLCATLFEGRPFGKVVLIANANSTYVVPDLLHRRDAFVAKRKRPLNGFGPSTSVTRGSRRCRTIPAFMNLVRVRNSGTQSPSQRRNEGADKAWSGPVSRGSGPSCHSTRLF